jgi:hypothetical protein
VDEELDGSRAKASMWPCDACDLASATLVDGAQHAPVKTAPCAHGNGAPARASSSHSSSVARDNSCEFPAVRCSWCGGPATVGALTDLKGTGNGFSVPFKSFTVLTTFEGAFKRSYFKGLTTFKGSVRLEML